MHEVRESTSEGFATWTLASPGGELAAELAPGAGMVGCSLRHRGEELLERRDGLRAYAEKGKTMGIPLLHPWANRLGGLRYEVGGRAVELDPEAMPIKLDPTGLPIHGALPGAIPWERVEHHADEAAARLRARADWAARPELLQVFPFPHEVEYEATVRGATLEIETTLHATGDVPVPVSFGFHPYLRLPGVPRAEWEVALPVRERLVLDERGLPTGRSEPFDGAPAQLGERAFDDAFAGVDPGGSFTVAGGGRMLAVTFEEGYPFAQVYSPPGAGFVCFEPMTAPTNALVSGSGLRFARPDEPFRARFEIAVRAG